MGAYVTFTVPDQERIWKQKGTYSSNKPTKLEYSLINLFGMHIESTKKNIFHQLE